MENFDAVLENYGVERADGIVIEGDAQHYAMQMPYYIVPEVKSAEPVSGFAEEKPQVEKQLVIYVGDEDLMETVM